MQISQKVRAVFTSFIKTLYGTNPAIFDGTITCQLQGRTRRNKKLCLFNQS